ncbi:MAG TPA: hypothetical protein VMZ50_00145 [Phycisphaerae bacterium]|nr:hypothetical protein [Phycisphaerae bacterium]
MARAWVSICVVGLLAATAVADTVVLKDGRTFTGTVTVEADAVLITVEYGSLRFGKDEVARIEIKDTPGAKLAKKLQAIDKDDPEELYAVAQWAAENALSEQAQELYTRVLTLDPNHSSARRALGYAKIDGEWRTFDQGLELSRSKLEAGQYRLLLDTVLPELERLAPGKDKALVIRELFGLTQLRSGKFAEAARTFKDLAERVGPSGGFRCATVAEVLQAHPDGMYLLTEAYPPTAQLLGTDRPARALEAGPVPLSNPLALEAALRDHAKKHVEAGQNAMAEAGKLDATDPDAARAKYTAAERAFDKADALFAGISRSWRVQMVRQRIVSLRKDVTAGAEKFDKELATLGKRSLPPAAYRNKILRLRYLLDNVRTDLKDILKIAEPYSRDLILEVRWAQLDLDKMDRMRQVVTEQLDGKK